MRTRVRVEFVLEHPGDRLLGTFNLHDFILGGLEYVAEELMISTGLDPSNVIIESGAQHWLSEELPARRPGKSDRRAAPRRQRDKTAATVARRRR